jgi:hypothetical protein
VKEQVVDEPLVLQSERGQFPGQSEHNMDVAWGQKFPFARLKPPQGRQAQDYGVRAELQLGEEHRLILANAFRIELIGRATKVSAEVGNTVKVCEDGCRGEIAALQLLKHELT